MEELQETEVTCYKIIPSNNLQPSSEELFEIEHSSSTTKEYQFPIHEEYKLAMARVEFQTETNAICQKNLEDIRKAKIHKLHTIEKRKLFLQQSEIFLSHLKRRQQASSERFLEFIEECRSQLRTLDEENDIISEDVAEFRTNLEEELQSDRT